MIIAVICAGGVRLHHMADRLAKAVCADGSDVPVGMTGSGAGLGRLDKALPVVAVKDVQW